MTYLLRTTGFAIAAMLVSASTYAAEVFYVDLAPYGPNVTTTVASRINDNVTEHLETTRVDFVSEVQADTSGGGNASITQAMMEYQRGIGLYVVNDFGEAATAFASALDLFREHASDLTDFAPVPDALFKLSESYFNSGNEELARVMLMRALALRPEQVVSDSSGQAYQLFYQSIQESLSRNGAGTVVITTQPSGLPVIFDGNDIGPSPATVSDVPAGEHYVRVQNDDGIGAGQTVSVSRGREAAVNLDLARAVSAVSGGVGGEPRYLRSLRAEVERGTVNESLTPYLRELSNRQGVEYVVVGVVVARDGAYEVLPFIYRASDGLFANVATTQFDSALSSISVNSYQVAANISNAVGNFPSSDLVTGAPIVIEEPEVEVEAPVVAAVSGPTVFEIEVPSAPAPAPAPTPAAPTPAPAPVVTTPAAPPTPVVAAPAAPTYTPPAAPAAPTYTPPAAPAAPAAPTYTPPTYGQPAQPAQPSYGQPTYGQPAQPAQPSYGQPTYGQPAQPAQPSYGQPTYGQPTQPAQPSYGQPTYGQPTQPAQPSYGQPTYGQPAQPAYGQPAQPTYDTAGQNGYGGQSNGFGTDYTTPNEPRERRSIARSPWLYVGGAVLVGGAVTAAVLASGGGSDSVNGVQPVVSW